MSESVSWVGVLDQMGFHYGRSWAGSRLEDKCPCSKASCGLVRRAERTCLEHGDNAARTMRQIHRGDQCPGEPSEPVDEDFATSLMNRGLEAMRHRIEDDARSDLAAKVEDDLAWIVHRACGCGPLPSFDGKPGPICEPNREDYDIARAVLVAGYTPPWDDDSPADPAVRAGGGLG